MGKKIPVWQCLLVMAVMIAALMWSIIVDDGGEPHIALIIAAAFAAIIGVINGRKWNYIEQGILVSINGSMQAMLILAIVGAMICSWLAAGTIPSLIGGVFIGVLFFLRNRTHIEAATGLDLKNSIFTIMNNGISMGIVPEGVEDGSVIAKLADLSTKDMVSLINRQVKSNEIGIHHMLFCDFAAFFTEILAILLQILIKKKNLRFFYDEIKESNITVFLVAMMTLNIVDFLIFDKDIKVAEYIVAAYLGALMLVWVRWIVFCVSYYEILGGHNRRDALKANGITKLSVMRGEIKIVKKDTYDSGDIMLDSNIQRDEIPVMDRAWACRIKLEIVQHRMSVSQLGTHKRSDQIAAEELQMSRNNVQRYARLTYLIPQLQDLANTTQLPINVGVEASYLTESQQEAIFSVWKDERKLPNIQQMKQIRIEAQEDFVDADTLKEMLSPAKEPEPLKTAFKSTQKRFRSIVKEKSALIDTHALEELLAKTMQEYLDNL